MLWTTRRPALWKQDLAPLEPGIMVRMATRDEINHASDLKVELVDYALSPGFNHLLRLLRAEGLQLTDNRQDALAYAVERMLFERPHADGKSVLERYLHGHRQLPPDDRMLLESWRDKGVYGVFEIVARHGDRLTLINLADELTYAAFATRGTEALTDARPGRYILTRVLPVRNEWMLSGVQLIINEEGRHIVGRLLRSLFEDDPLGPFRNPAKRHEALEINRECHRIFVDLFGSDAVAGTGREAAEHRRQFLEKVSTRFGTGDDTLRESLTTATSSAPAIVVPAVREDLLAAEDVVLLNDPVKGVALIRDHGRLEDAFRAPPSSADADGVALVRRYLDDESIPGYVFTRLATRYPDTVDALFRLVLDDPDFVWAADGEELLENRKPEWYETADEPDLLLMARLVRDSLPAKFEA